MKILAHVPWETTKKNAHIHKKVRMCIWKECSSLACYFLMEDLQGVRVTAACIQVQVNELQCILC